MLTVWWYDVAFRSRAEVCRSEFGWLRTLSAATLTAQVGVLQAWFLSCWWACEQVRHLLAKRSRNWIPQGTASTIPNFMVQFSQ